MFCDISKYFDSDDILSISNESFEDYKSRYALLGIDKDVSYVPMAFIDEYCVNILKMCNEELTFEEIGYKLVESLNKTTNYKFGENRSKLLIQLGLLRVVKVNPARVVLSDSGMLLLNHPSDFIINYMTRLTAYLPIIHNVLLAGEKGEVDLDSFMPSFITGSSIKRRHSSIKHILEDIEGVYSKCVVCCNQKSNDDELINDFPTDCSDESPADTSVISIDDCVERLDESEAEGSINYEQTESVDFSESIIPNDMEFDSFSFESKQITPEMLVDSESNDYLEFEADEHSLLNVLKSIAFDCYNVSTELSLKTLHDALLYIIEDPESDFIIRSMANVALGYFVKYGRNTKESIDECIYISLYALNCIY